MRRRIIHLTAACGFAILLLVSITRAEVRAVTSIGMTVDDMDRSVDFYTRVLGFKKTSDTEIVGESFEKLYGVFGLRARIVTLELGEESIELTEFLTPRGKLIPRD